MDKHIQELVANIRARRNDNPLAVYVCEQLVALTHGTHYPFKVYPFKVHHADYPHEQPLLGYIEVERFCDRLTRHRCSVYLGGSTVTVIAESPVDFPTGPTELLCSTDLATPNEDLTGILTAMVNFLKKAIA